MAKSTEKTETKVIDPSEQLGKYLKDNKEDHYNFEDDVCYKVSTGSLGLDIETGMLTPGVHRLVGPPGGGKSSEALEIARNFINTVSPSRVVYVKSEGRLSDEVIIRSGLQFTKNYEEWSHEKVFIFECNIYETVIGLFRDLITNNPSGTRYLFIVDSADAINLKNDIVKKIEDGNKVAGAPLLTKQFLQKCALAMAKRGHMCLFLGQQSADINLDPYKPGQPRQVKGSGGNAVAHFANQVLEFQEWYEGDLILEDPDARVDRLKNRPIGHTVRIKLKKSDKETRYVTVEIPIKHGQSGGNSIWREREVGDQMLIWQLVSKTNPNPSELKKGKEQGIETPKKGAWLYFALQLITELKDNGIVDLPEKVQGLNQLYDLLSERKDVTKYLFNKFRKMIGGETNITNDTTS